MHHRPRLGWAVYTVQIFYTVSLAVVQALLASLFRQVLNIATVCSMDQVLENYSHDMNQRDLVKTQTQPHKTIAKDMLKACVNKLAVEKNEEGTNRRVNAEW